jgi:hypothetical protein
MAVVLEIEEEWGTEKVYLRMQSDRTATVALGKITERELVS